MEDKPIQEWSDQELLKLLADKAEDFRMLMVEHALMNLRQNLFIDQLRALERAISLTNSRLTWLESTGGLMLKPKYQEGDQVWLAKFDNGDFVVPREKAIIIGVQINDTEVMYTGKVKPSDKEDDGLREFSEDQIERKVETGE